jgi:hypothetical protein
MSNHLRRLGIPMVLLLALVGCARSRPTGSDPGSGHSNDPAGLILKVEIGGGFVAPQAQLREVPFFALYGDGRLIVPGPQMDIYPGPALPNLQVRTISEAGIQAILSAAKAAGLLGPDRHFDALRVADAPTTTFTVVADGLRHVVSVQALGMDEPSPDATQEEIRARRELSDFQERLSDLAGWLPQGSVGDERTFRPDELRVYVTPYEPAQDLREPAMDWPLSGSLGFEPLSWSPATRCGTVAGPDLGSVLTAAGMANELTPWKADGARWGLVFRPLLPDESGCA